MAKQDITQLERATTVPAGSLHLVEMGDGSGTKAVTQEVLEEKMRESLKVGDLKELQTEDEYRELWKVFFNTIGIESRYNPKCQQNHMPEWYRRNMTEFE